MDYKTKCIYPDCIPECNKYQPLCNAGIVEERPKRQFFKGIFYGCLFMVIIIALFIAVILYNTKPL